MSTNVRCAVLGSGFAGSTVAEVARRVLAVGFDELRLHRIQATCFPRNVASARVMEKAGLTYEGLLRGYLLKGDRFEDVLIYARLRDE